MKIIQSSAIIGLLALIIMAISCDPGSAIGTPASSSPTNANLGGISFTLGTMTPEFSENITEYSLELPPSTSSISLTLATAATPATIKYRVGSGSLLTVNPANPVINITLSFAGGTSILQLVVTSGDATATKTYTISIHVPDKVSSISSLSVDGNVKNPVYTTYAGAYLCTHTVLQSQDSVTLAATLTSAVSSAQIQVNGGTAVSLVSGTPIADIPLNLGTNNLLITVTAEDPNYASKYLVKVIRRYPGALELTSFYPGNTWTFKAIVQPDGKILCGGYGVKRFLADGTVDPTFTTLPLGGTYLNSMALQADGKLVIVGNFTAVDSVSKGYIARLNADGTLDNTFMAGGAGGNYAIFSVAVDAVGKIYAGGNFTRFNEATCYNIVRLNADGSVDTAFTGRGTGNILKILPLASGQILVGGNFFSYATSSYGNLALVNSDGTADSGFSNPAPNSSVNEIVLLSDGKYLIGGGFTACGASSLGRIARLNANGSLDTSFVTGTGAPSAVQAILVLADGKIVVGGRFTSFNGTSKNYIVGLDANGGLDSLLLSAASGFDAAVEGLALQSNGRILVCGQFQYAEGLQMYSFVRLWNE